jgi:hypothetical protein
MWKPPSLHVRKPSENGRKVHPSSTVTCFCELPRVLSSAGKSAGTHERRDGLRARLLRLRLSDGNRELQRHCRTDTGCGRKCAQGVWEKTVVQLCTRSLWGRFEDCAMVGWLLFFFSFRAHLSFAGMHCML